MKIRGPVSYLHPPVALGLAEGHWGKGSANEARIGRLEKKARGLSAPCHGQVGGAPLRPFQYLAKEQRAIVSGRRFSDNEDWGWG